ncbi:MAG: T9SS type A sorting domain-containing protein [candidate division WOR-3 bacterium]
MRNFSVFLFLLSLYGVIAKEIDKPTGDWCYTIPALLEFQKEKKLQRPNLSGPVEYIERERFRVHYTRSGVDAVSQVYAESVASYISYSWAKQIDTLNWPPPPPDYGLGGDDRFDVYIHAMPQGIAGYCAPEYNYPNPYPNGATSYIAIGNDLSIGGFLKIVCAHEFNHALQFRFSSREDNFWYENTSTWMEDVCFEEVNSYLSYLSTSPGPLTTPYYPINTFIQGGLFQYAGGIWAMFLEDKYERDCLRKIWERQGQIAGNNTLEAFDYVLRNFYNSSLNDALKEYGIWRYFTGSRADTIRFFKEGNLWPSVSIMRTHNSYPVSGNSVSYEPVVPGGCDYIQFVNGGGKLFISFDGDDGFNWKAIVIGYQREEPQIYEINLNNQAQGQDSFDWRLENNFTLVPIVAHWEYGIGYQLNFNYQANIRILHDVGVERISGFPSISDSNSIIYPNALIKNYGQFQENFQAKLTCGDFYTDIKTITLNPNDTQTIYFNPCTLKGRNYQYYKCTTLLANDERPTNNFKEGRIFIRVRDVGVVRIIEPNGYIGQGSYIQPKARIKNFGNLREEFDVIFTINNWQTQKRVAISANNEIDIIFDSLWYASDTGQHVAKCSTRLDSDINPSNDKREEIFYVTLPAVEEKDYFVISQKKSDLFINNLIKENKNIEIYDINGRNVDNKRIKKGIYYLLIKEKNIFRKLIII